MRATWKMKKLPDGTWEGVIVLPFDPAAVPGGGGAIVQARGATRADALGKAAVIARQALESPALQALLPPGAGVALKAAGALAKAAKVGKLGAAVSRFTGPAMRRLGKVLGF